MRLSKEENVARGYAVYNPHGVYRKPITGKLTAYADSGHITLDAWGNVSITDKWDDDINAIPKPEILVYTPADVIEAALDDIAMDEILSLREAIVSKYPDAAYEFSYLVEDKPAGLVAMEKELHKKLDEFYTPERKAVDKANQKAQAAYDNAVSKILNERSALAKKLEIAESFKQRAIETKYAPAAVAERNKIATMYALAKESSSKREAKRLTVLAIAGMLGKGMSEPAIFTEIKDTPAFMALAGKREEKVFDYVYASTVAWIRHKNQHKVFWDLLGWVAEGISNTKIRKDNKACLPGILTLVALHQAKDNDSRGLVAFKYLSRIAVVSSANFELDPSKTGRKLEAYAAQDYITYAKGIQGGVASRAGLKPYSRTLTAESASKAVEAILNSFQDSPFKTALQEVLSSLTVVSSANSVAAPAYNNKDLEAAVEDLLTIFVPLTRIAADDRIAERHIESVEFEAEKEAYIAEQTERVNKHLASGVGFQPIWMPRKPSESHAEALI